MSFDLETLYKLLPAVYRIRDLEQLGNGLPFDSLQEKVYDSSIHLPLKALLEVIAEQIAVLEENLDQLYDDQFIETCAEWAIPYIGDLVSNRLLNDAQNLRNRGISIRPADTNAPPNVPPAPTSGPPGPGGPPP